MRLGTFINQVHAKLEVQPTIRFKIALIGEDNGIVLLIYRTIVVVLIIEHDIR